MSYRIWKRFEFSASHQLKGLPKDHQCARLHGHNYGVELELEAPSLDEHGFVLDYGDMGAFADFIKFHLDHFHLNDAVSFSPTAERLAYWLYEQAVKALEPLDYRITAVRVSETPKTWAEYRPT